MSENIIVNIVEKTNDETFFDGNDITLIENLIENEKIEENTDNSEDTTMAMHMEYDLNFNVKQLKAIANYYKINIKKMKKEEIIENIILFELADENQSIVYTRKRLWFFVEELKNNDFFKNIIFPF
tara:strand:+ start:48 stop:425 length:378 start_codon:yes stop_codon:yes gene_type:complete